MNLVTHEPRSAIDKVPDRVTSIENRLDGHRVDRYTISMVDASRFHITRHWASLMQPWPQSWAGISDDVPIGVQLVQLFIPFVEHLQQQNLTRKTIRRHVDNLWCIGGEIIRDLHLDSTLRRQSASNLLRQAIPDGLAPLVRNASEAEQRAFDATARKLAKFLAVTTT